MHSYRGISARLQKGVVRGSLVILALAWPVVLPGQQQGGRVEPLRPATPPGGLKAEMVNGKRAVPQEVLFRFKESAFAAASPQQVNTLINDLRKSEDAEEFEMLSDAGVLRIRSRSKNADALVRTLSRRVDIEYAEPNYIVHVDATAPVNDPRFGDLWGLQNTGQGVIPGKPGADIKAVNAWAMTKGSTSNVVAVVDTGVDYNHPDLAANMWRAPAAFSVTVGGVTITCAAGTRGFNAITNTCDPMDDHDHGTHVAGTIGAAGNNNVGVVGVNHTTRIMGLKFLDAYGYGSTSDAIKALEFAIQVKAKFAATKGANVRVLNNSWGGGAYSQALVDMIRRTYQNDMLFVAAAGNDWFDIDFTPQYPASYTEPNILTIAATDNQDLRAYFSNYGVKSVHLAAPGENILSTTRGSTYKSFSGTSMATPHVAGAAALVLSNCAVDTISLRNILMRTGDKLSSLTGVVATGARLNVAAAINSCSGPYYTVSTSPQELTVLPGRSDRYVVTLTPYRSYTGTVTMSVTGLPAGVTGTFSPAVVNVAGAPLTTTLTLTASLTVVPGVHWFTVLGTSSNQQRTVPTAVRVPGYAVTDLGTLSAPAGSREVSAADVNNTNQAVGYSKTAQSGWYSVFNHGFLSSAGTIRDLGTLGGPISEAARISNGGHVAGWSLNTAGYARAFLYSGGRMQDLGALSGHSESYALGVNDSGYVVGYSGNGSQSERAFLKATGSMQNLGTLGGSWSRAYAINNLGQVVGASEKAIYQERAFLYSNGTMKDLGTIGGNPDGYSRAVDINDKGQAVGHSTVGTDLFTIHAAVWSSGTVKDLGGLQGKPYSYAKGINGAGHVVGWVGPTDESIVGDEKRAFLYRDGRMLDLNTALPGNTPWVLLEATAINDSGVIVGTGKLNNELRGFLLTPLK